MFTGDFGELLVSHKRKEHEALRLRPHPNEFFLYDDLKKRTQLSESNGMALAKGRAVFFWSAPAIRTIKSFTFGCRSDILLP